MPHNPIPSLLNKPIKRSELDCEAAKLWLDLGYLLQDKQKRYYFTAHKSTQIFIHLEQKNEE